MFGLVWRRKYEGGWVMEPGEGHASWNHPLPHGRPFSAKMPVDRMQRAELFWLRQMQKNQKEGEMGRVLQPNIPRFESHLCHLLPILLLGKSLHFHKPQFSPLKKDTVTLFRQR